MHAGCSGQDTHAEIFLQVWMGPEAELALSHQGGEAFYP